ncbi:MAG: 3-oxoacyl-ACP reductase FabG [Anaerolineae bacterium]
MDLKGKVALVTGAAHRVGRAIALALAREGAHVVVHYGGSSEAAARTQAEIAARGVEAVTVSANLADPAAIAALFETTADRFGRLDVLVNSAARFDKRAFDAITLEDWERSMAVNVRAPFLAMQHAARLMRAAARPADQPALIVNIADLSGVYPWRDYVQHGVSKAGLLHLTKIGARELAPHVRVNAIIPGPILPPPGMDPASTNWQETVQAVPLQREGGAEVIGETVVFLARNDFITGAVINVDGGEGLLGVSTH